jgi:hypothetical protein
MTAKLRREPVDLDAVLRHTYIAAADSETVRRMAIELKAAREAKKRIETVENADDWSAWAAVSEALTAWDEATGEAS